MIRIGRFRESDLAAVHDTIMSALEDVRLNKVYESTEPWKALYTQKYILGISRLRHLYVAEREGKIVGCAAVHPDEGMAYVSTVYTHSACHGMGVGRMLLDALEDDEISITSGRMKLHAALTAKRFYEGLGYQVEEKFPEVVMDSGIETLVMVKEL